MESVIQITLENDRAILYPLYENDFDALFTVASDPKIWEQHPNRDRWKKDVFQTFFDGGIQSKGAFKIIDKASGKVAGSTRFYDYNPKDKSIKIGYTFYGVDYWGKGINSAVKVTMLDHAFQYVEQVYFEIGANNIRSQIAINRLGAKKISEKQVAYFGEMPKLNFVYSISKTDWLMNKQPA